MKGRIGDQQRLLHIKEAIEEIKAYIEGVDYSEFTANSMMRFATIKQIEIIGEAARHLSLETKAVFPDIEWKEIIGLRNFLAHEYFGVDRELLWQIIRVDIPNLYGKLFITGS